MTCEQAKMLSLVLDGCKVVSHHYGRNGTVVYGPNNSVARFRVTTAIALLKRGDIKVIASTANETVYAAA